MGKGSKVPIHPLSLFLPVSMIVFHVTNKAIKLVITHFKILRTMNVQE